MEKLMTFKVWIKKVYGVTHLELLTKPVSFQQTVNIHYQEYLRVWEEEEVKNDNN